MPYRGPEGFSWHSSDASARRRALAAVVLLGAGWAIGFFAGRMSAWLFPVAGTNTAVVANVTPAPASPPAEQPASAPLQREAVRPPPAPPASATAADSAATAPSSPEEKGASRTEASASERAGTTPDKAPPVPETSTATPEKAEPAPSQRASGAAPKDDSREQDPTRAPGRDVVLVNPEWKSQPDPEPERRAYRPEAETGQGRLADESALAKCESRYSSFRRSDGTYQPYGRSTREPCPFLSDMPRRPRY